MPFDFIWFDLGNTLIHREREKLFAAVLEKSHGGKSSEDIKLAFHRTDKLFMRDFPGLLGKPAEEFLPLYFGFLCRHLNVGGDLVSLLGEWAQAWKKAELAWRPYPRVPGLLEHLASRGARGGVCPRRPRPEARRSDGPRCRGCHKFPTRGR